MPDSVLSSELRVTDLGRMEYAQAVAVQRQTNRAVSQHHSPPTILMVEHDPVITISHRRKAADHLLASHQRLDELGIDVQPTDRGGDITYHGPGQLVVYPIIRLNELGLNLGRYMRVLEQLVIEAVGEFGIMGHQRNGATGVWVEDPVRGPAKLCAMGVRIRKNTTMHGLALNVSTDLSHFQTITPCGLNADQSTVTSLIEQSGQTSPSMEQVKRTMVNRLSEHLSALKPGTHAR